MTFSCYRAILLVSFWQPALRGLLAPFDDMAGLRGG